MINLKYYIFPTDYYGFVASEEPVKEVETEEEATTFCANGQYQYFTEQEIEQHNIDMLIQEIYRLNPLDADEGFEDGELPF